MLSVIVWLFICFMVGFYLVRTGLLVRDEYGRAKRRKSRLEHFRSLDDEHNPPVQVKESYRRADLDNSYTIFAVVQAAELEAVEEFNRSRSEHLDIKPLETIIEPQPDPAENNTPIFYSMAWHKYTQIQPGTRWWCSDQAGCGCFACVANHYPEPEVDPFPQELDDPFPRYDGFVYADQNDNYKIKPLRDHMNLSRKDYK